VADGEDDPYRLTQRQRILGVYPFLYTLIYRLNLKWRGEEAARDYGSYFVTFIEFPGIMALIAFTGVIDHLGALAFKMISLASIAVVGWLNHRLLVKKHVGTRFADDFDWIGLTDRTWLTFYSLIFVGLCFAPMIVVAHHHPFKP